METHANHLHHAPGKKFRHYFFEFLMLFIAVFCGFIAENYREHLTDNIREKQYMQSMVEDLKQDIASMDDCLEFNEGSNKQIDTLLDIMEKTALDNNDIVVLYRVVNGASEGRNAISSQRTLSQLKNSGMMRLIHNHLISDSLNAYDADISQERDIYKTIDEQTTLVTNSSCAIFDFRYVRSVQRRADIESGKVIPVLLTTDKTILRQFANYALIVKAVKGYHTQFLKGRKEFAKRLIKMIQEEYHLE